MGAAPRPSRPFDTAALVMRAIVLVPVLPQSYRTARPAPDDANGAGAPAPKHSPQDRLAEATGLAQAVDLDVCAEAIIQVATPKPATLMGSGKVAEIKAMIEELNAGLVIVDHALTPVQQRNLETAWGAKVLDRTGLILEIFGKRARTREGVLQVELAHLTYQRSRLVRSWTHLERQRGGRGFLGGPGEAQVELDRRMLEERIEAIKRDLEKVSRTRTLHRVRRRRSATPVVAIVGYTNAGKSTLFNRLTGAGVLAADQVFATLDPTMRVLKLHSGRRIVLSDTVGFISDLPVMLVAAFRATLEEVIEADLIVHVRDIAHPESEAQRTDVEQVLRELGIDTVPADRQILEVWNKIDLLDPDQRRECIAAAAFKERQPILISAGTGEGMGTLIAAIERRLSRGESLFTVELSHADGALIHWLHETTDVVEQSSDEAGVITCTLRVPAERRHQILSRLDGLKVSEA